MQLARLRIGALAAVAAGLLGGSVLLGGCDLLGGEDPSITGTYRGETRIQRFVWRFRIALTETGNGMITGAGSRSPVEFDEAEAFTVTGVYDHPDLTLTLKFTDQRDKQFIGRVSGNGEQLTGRYRDTQRSRELILVRNK